MVAGRAMIDYANEPKAAWTQISRKGRRVRYKSGSVRDEAIHSSSRVSCEP
jgi:hypothetical protein